MQIMITHGGGVAPTRVLQLNRWQLAVLLAGLGLALVTAVAAIYHFVLVKAVREGWPVVSQAAGLLVRDDATQRDRFLRENLDASHGLYFSQRLLLALVESGLPRDEAYGLVQRLAMTAWDGGQDFRELAAADPVVADRVDLASVFDLGPYTRHVDVVFDRLDALRRESVDA